MAEVLSAHGYAPTPHDDQYWPEPPVLKVETAVEIEEAIAAIEPVATQNGHILLLDTLAAVLTPALVIDDVAETLVYLEMVGAKQSVKANWTALAGGGKVHWLGRQRIRLNGMKANDFCSSRLSTRPLVIALRVK
ncbi:MAG: hypothetical protein D6835_03165 [Candidatus Thermofonsia bacterium]|nr:MAG: hypothetical protein D6835_03165 [Candidatus Thermofonsia bacterium]